MSLSDRPVVGLSACRVDLDGVPNDVCRTNYIRAVWEHAGCLPVILPALGREFASPSLLDSIDGLVLTGSVSNVDPAHYGQRRDSSKAYDPDRDATVFALIDAAIDLDLPILAICRGMHELNVALGGSLFQNVHQVDGKMDHRENESQPRSIQYAPAHRVCFAIGGLCHQIFKVKELVVSSLHWQGIDRLGMGLTVEAVADDGLIEAVSFEQKPNFVVGVQWHPEWFANDAYGMRLFRRFGAECRIRRQSRQNAALTYHSLDSSRKNAIAGVQGAEKNE